MRCRYDGTMKPCPTRRYTRAEKARLWRWALVGAGIFGALGFFGGIALCLRYKLPIPPLFTTELGLLIGGSVGALFAICFPPASPEGEPEAELW
jgi:hypothetical protein